MRRKDREMDVVFAWDVFDRADHAVLALAESYAIPVSPARLGQTIYIHCAPVGEKLDKLDKDNKVSLVSVGNVAPTVQDFSTEYESAIFKGTLEMVEDEAEKRQALEQICRRYTPYLMAQFDTYLERSFHRTAVLKMTVTEVTAKRKKLAENSLI